MIVVNMVLRMVMCGSVFCCCLQNMPVILDDENADDEEEDEFMPSSTTFIKPDMNRDVTWDDVS